MFSIQNKTMKESANESSEKVKLSPEELKRIEKIGAGADMTNELEQGLVEKDRSRERKDLKGLKGQVEQKKKAA